MVEVYSDSLNTKSEEKKYSISNEEEILNRSSPSFYKIDDSENGEMEGVVKEDLKDYHH